MPETPPADGLAATVARGRLSVQAGPDGAGARIDRFLGRLLAPHFSRSYLAALVEEGTVTVGGRAVRPSYRLAPGDRIEGRLGEPASHLPGPEADVPVTVLAADEALIVVDKPSGMIVHPGSGSTSGTLVNGLLARFPELSVVGRAERPGIVHRLDRETTGVMVVARTNEAARSLVGQFKRKTVVKRYTAVVWGEMPLDSDWIDLPLGKDPRRPTRRAVVAAGGQAASTFYEVEERLGRATLVTASPRTGRTHQIRVHLAHLGFPVVGDVTYDRRLRPAWNAWIAERRQAGLPVPAIARHALHARSLTVRHPLTGAEVTYEAPLPADMAELVAILRAG